MENKIISCEILHFPIKIGKVLQFIFDRLYHKPSKHRIVAQRRKEKNGHIWEDWYTWVSHSAFLPAFSFSSSSSFLCSFNANHNWICSRERWRLTRGIESVLWLMLSVKMGLGNEFFQLKNANYVQHSPFFESMLYRIHSKNPKIDYIICFFCCLFLFLSPWVCIDMLNLR